MQMGRLSKNCLSCEGSLAASFNTASLCLGRKYFLLIFLLFENFVHLYHVFWSNPPPFSFFSLLFSPDHIYLPTSYAFCFNSLSQCSSAWMTWGGGSISRRVGGLSGATSLKSMEFHSAAAVNCLPIALQLINPSHPCWDFGMLDLGLYILNGF